VVWLAGEIGDVIAVKAPLVRLDVAGPADTSSGDDQPAHVEPVEPKPAPSHETVAEERLLVAKPAETAKPPVVQPASGSVPRAVVSSETKPLASPAVRRRAQDAGVDLRQVHGSGPAGRITHEDLDAYLSGGAQAPTAVAPARNTATEAVKVTGLRRRIAEKMSLSASRIPHITYVEEVDVTALEELRTKMNAERRPDQPKLTVLPFLMRAMVKAVVEQPDVNATFDDDAGMLTRFGAVHIGIATQTAAGLAVPVVKHAEARGIWDCATEMNRLAEATRAGTATRDELTGSTITISSLGALGGIVSTPVINHPEVAIVGVNKIATRPVWDGTQFVPRKMMNLSSSFDHRIVDGWNAATFVQRLRVLMETPALIFIEG
jgi:2-oxoisovalerate dehydrogenase E2 component (dihydrolipoyl transacylase)